MIRSVMAVVALFVTNPSSAESDYIFCVSDSSEPSGFTFSKGLVFRSFISEEGVTARIETPRREIDAYTEFRKKLHWQS